MTIFALDPIGFITRARSRCSLAQATYLNVIVRSKHSPNLGGGSTSDAMEHLFEHLEETLIQVKFHDEDNPRQLMTRIRRMFSRIQADQMEVNILRGFLSAINRLGGKSGN